MKVNDKKGWYFETCKLYVSERQIQKLNERPQGY